MFFLPLLPIPNPKPHSKNRKQKTCKPSPRNLVLLSTQSPSSVQLPYPLTVFFQSFSQLLSSPHRLHLNFFESTLLLLRGFSFVIFLEKAPLANFVRRLPFHLPLTLKIGFNCVSKTKKDLIEPKPLFLPNSSHNPLPLHFPFLLPHKQVVLRERILTSITLTPTPNIPRGVTTWVGAERKSAKSARENERT